MTREEALDLAKKLAGHVVLYGPKLATIRDEGESELGNIIIPTEAKRKPLSARVILIGQGLRPTDTDDPSAGLRVGDHVYHTRYNPTLFEITIDDERIELESMHISDIHMGVND